ncbi:entry exclusion lipoprotein TrbK [Ralstonia pseudosolanacearum]|uniref:Entry exclusion lipoprotein TrbK n=1 Tax=Ralstonia solanacearum TaxID=305 RepID=A0AA92EA69_RALSL|nr:entry exclusion lipoprotein TrbK [Ralstonia pseudosolanacearum]QCX48157.1 entry exclusion lipoprotein TrbK [Ralstonia pseudosolanacearum]
MKKIIPLLLASMLIACSKSEPAKTSTTSEQSETVESLAANPERLKELRLQCKTDRAKLGDKLCNRVAEATNRRFLSDGKTPYTPPKESPKF